MKCTVAEGNGMSYQVISKDGHHMLVIGNGLASTRIPITEYNVQNSTDGTTELHIVISGKSTEFSTSAILKEVNL